MLVLSRKEGERIMIDSRIQVTILAVRGNRVRLGVIAPEEVAIHREEVFRRVELERQKVLPNPTRQCGAK